MFLMAQRLFTADMDFYRDWTDYKNGFGAATGDFWLGNDDIHNLTDKVSDWEQTRVQFKSF